MHRAPASKWSPRPPPPVSAAGPARAAPRPSNDGGRVSPRPLPGGNRLSPRPSNDGRASPDGRVSPIGGRVSPVGGGPYPSAARVVADAHAAQVQRQKALAAQQAQRQQARAGLEEEKRRLAVVTIFRLFLLQWHGLSLPQVVCAHPGTALQQLPQPEWKACRLKPMS